MIEYFPRPDTDMTETLYDFRSDNVGGAAPEILEAIIAANAGTAAPYGDDDYTRRMNERFAAVFEHPVKTRPPLTTPPPIPVPTKRQMRSLHPRPAP